MNIQRFFLPVGAVIVSSLASAALVNEGSLNGCAQHSDFEFESHSTVSCNNNTTEPVTRTDIVLEPSSLAVLGFGLIGLAFMRSRV